MTDYVSLRAIAAARRGNLALGWPANVVDNPSVSINCAQGGSLLRAHHERVNGASKVAAPWLRPMARNDELPSSVTTKSTIVTASYSPSPKSERGLRGEVAPSSVTPLGWGFSPALRRGSLHA
jgi:hypothetical protein